VEEEEEADEEADEEVVAVEAKAGRQLLGLFKRLSLAARLDAGRTQNVAQRTYIYRWFAIMANFIPAEEMSLYLMPIILPVYRTMTDETNKTDEFASLKELASELLTLVQKRVGDTVYFAAYSTVRQRAEAKRHERKSKRALQAMVDPEAYALKKIRNNEKKKLSAKRKIAKERESKGRLPQMKRARGTNLESLLSTYADTTSSRPMSRQSANHIQSPVVVAMKAADSWAYPWARDNAIAVPLQQPRLCMPSH
ncbi:hypothetical protein SYNPS1DRAFT_28453, partial [Syncephalis pseudoplumigaleata]